MEALMLRHLIRAAILTALVPVAAFASPDELYYPASSCQPFNAGAWHGSGAEGFSFLSSVGGLYNFDTDDAEALVCPVPYYRDTNDLAPITVRVVVEDRHHSLGITAFLCGRDSTGPKICDSANNFPTVFGTSTLELTIQPVAGTRFVWIEVLIPDDDEDNNPFSDRGTSGLLGYRVLRP
jgi:hypothetical protein